MTASQARATEAITSEGPMTEKKLRVLVVEDSIGEARAALRILYPETEGRMDLTDVGSLSTVLPTISMVNPDVALMDLSLAGPDPVDSIRRLHRSAPQLPLIVIAKESEKGEAVRCLDVGAVEYLLKGFVDARTVARALRIALERNTVSALADLLRDPATNLYTRDGLLTLGTQACEAAQRNGGTLVLLCVLLENLATLRQEFGSRAVDQTVRDLAGILSGSFRRTDVVARMGEGQFAALAVDAVEPSAPVLFQRVKRRVEAQNKLRDLASGMRLRLAVGFWSREHAGTFNELLERVESELCAGSVATEHDREWPADVVSR